MIILSSYEKASDEHTGRPSQEIETILRRCRQTNDRVGIEAYRRFSREGRAKTEKVTRMERACRVCNRQASPNPACTGGTSMTKIQSTISAISRVQNNHKNLHITLILANGERPPLAYDEGKYSSGVLRVPGSYELDGTKLLSFRARILTNRPKLVCQALGVEYPNACVWGA